MTTIVVDREMGYMAADRMATSNDGDVSILCEKIRTFDIGGEAHLVSCAGNEGPALIFEEWYEYGDWDSPPDPMPELGEDDDFTAIVLQPGRILIADKFMRLYPIDERWYAAGSGGVFAWAILRSGCGIEKAMETAIDMDPNSGFDYDIVYRQDAQKELDKKNNKKPKNTI